MSPRTPAPHILTPPAWSTTYWRRRVYVASNGRYWTLVGYSDAGQRVRVSLGPKSRYSEQDAEQIANALDLVIRADRDPTFGGLARRMREMCGGGESLQDGPREPNVLRVHGVDHELPPLVFRLARAAWESSSGILTESMLSEDVWEGSVYSPGALKSAVHDLNRAAHAAKLPWIVAIKARRVIVTRVQTGRKPLETGIKPVVAEVGNRLATGPG